MMNNNFNYAQLLKNIEDNKTLLENSQRSKAYNDILNEFLTPSNEVGINLKDLAEEMSKSIDYSYPEVAKQNKFASALQNFKTGFNENLRTPFAPENMQKDPNKTFGNRFGEAMGTAARFLDSSLGRMALMGGITALGGGSGLDILNYGLGAGVLNQGLRNQDSLYRQQLLDSGVPAEVLNNVQGYITPETYNNFVKGQYMHDNTEIERDYKQGMLNLGQYEAETDRENKETKNQIDLNKSFVPASDYYKALYEQGFIPEAEYQKIVTAPDFDPTQLINLDLSKLVADKQNANSKAKKVEDDIKTSKQKRYYFDKNGGKTVMKVEYGEKPVQRSVMEVNHHYYGKGGSQSTNGKKTNPNYKGSGGKSPYSQVYSNNLPDSKKKVVF